MPQKELYKEQASPGSPAGAGGAGGAKNSSLLRVTLGDTGQTWDELADCLEAFVAAWEEGTTEPQLAAFVPHGAPALRRLILVELIKVDLEYRWSRQRRPRRVEEYARDFPELTAAGLPVDLLYEEYHVRKQAGEAIHPEDFLARFPAQADELERLFGLHPPEKSLGLDGGKLAGLEAGQQVDDFDLLTVLGQGAFASVFLARQRSLQRLVALKVSANRGTEPQTLAQLDHPSIVRVYDQRLLPERGLRLLYMQYLAGGDLQRLIAGLRSLPPDRRTGRSFLENLDEQLRQRGEEPPLDSPLRRRLADLSWPEVVCWLGARLAAALDYAHRRGVLHCDVKPANVLLTAEGLPRLADFNISCCSKLEGASPTAFFGGTLAYMAPEQLEACNPAHPAGPESLDGRTDLYSLGVTLWELLTGERPFADEQVAAGWSSTLTEMAARRRAGMAPDVIARLPPDCPPGLAATLLACLDPVPERRCSSGKELAWQLELCLQPRHHQLFNTPAAGWQRAVLAFPVLAVLLAATLPNLLAVLALVLTSSASCWALTALSAGGLVSVSVVFLLFRALQVALDALARAVSPDEERLTRHSH